jgi:precorrin-8X/cobalt-precorrin-8 methylmutase
MTKLNHPIVTQSFGIIDQEVTSHHLNPSEYAIARRVIHTTADFDFLELLKFNHEAIAYGIKAIQDKMPIITDVNMVKQGILNLVKKTFNNEVICALDFVDEIIEEKTRTETGILNCFKENPQGIYVIGNAPTALITLCENLKKSPIKPALIIGVPVGFVKVVESKEILKNTSIPHILTEGRKGGSPVAAAILNQLLILATEK